MCLLTFNAKSPNTPDDVHIDTADKISPNVRQDVGDIIVHNTNFRLGGSIKNNQYRINSLTVDEKSNIEIIADKDNVRFKQFKIDNSTLLVNDDTEIITDKIIAKNMNAICASGKASLTINVATAEIDRLIGKNIDIEINQYCSETNNTTINNITTNEKLQCTFEGDAYVSNSKGNNGTEIEAAGYKNKVNLDKVENITKLKGNRGCIDMQDCQVESQEAIDNFKGKIHYNKNNTKIGNADNLPEKTTIQGILKGPELGQG